MHADEWNLSIFLSSLLATILFCFCLLLKTLLFLCCKVSDRPFTIPPKVQTKSFLPHSRPNFVHLQVSTRYLGLSYYKAATKLEQMKANTGSQIKSSSSLILSLERNLLYVFGLLSSDTKKLFDLPVILMWPVFKHETIIEHCIKRRDT